jgi:hypothetical protein
MAALTRFLNSKDRRVLATGKSSLLKCDKRPGCTKLEWRVTVHVHERLIRRQVCYAGKPWLAGGKGWRDHSRDAEEVIWPTWPATLQEEMDASASPLANLEAHWDSATSRLRDSAKWMATVLGAALAAVIPTAPLTDLSRHFPVMSAVVGLAGLALVGVTLVLVLQVMHPQPVFYDEIEDAGPPSGLRGILYGLSGGSLRAVEILASPLYKWQFNITRHPDLYLPCGVDSLSELRQLMVVEELTLSALASAEEDATDAGTCRLLKLARVARAARLHELRAAAASVVAVGVFYKVRTCSTRATYLGAACGVLGIMAIIFALASSGRT